MFSSNTVFTILGNSKALDIKQFRYVQNFSYAYVVFSKHKHRQWNDPQDCYCSVSVFFRIRTPRPLDSSISCCSIQVLDLENRIFLSAIVLMLTTNLVAGTKFDATKGISERVVELVT